MMLATAKMSTKGQIVIPKLLREELGLKPVDPLAVGVDGDRIILRKSTLADLLEESMWTLVYAPRVRKQQSH